MAGSPILVVDEHLLEVSIAGFRMARVEDLPFRIDDKRGRGAFRCSRDDKVRADAFRIPKRLVLLRTNFEFRRSCPNKHVVDVFFPQGVHVEEEGEHLVLA